MKRISERSTEKEQIKLIATSTDKMPNLCTKPSLVGEVLGFPKCHVAAH
jgi:hypothetical protein